MANHAAVNLEKDWIVLFDGVCNLCSASVQFIVRHDRLKRFRFVPIQSEDGQELYSTFGLNPAEMPSLMLLKNGQAYLMSDAAIEITRSFSFFWKPLLVCKLIPRRIRNGVYSFIARNRYRWFGRNDVCRLE